ncbi:MAG: tetratricopeptide repeat protein [Candidatus Omnitrophota bacterium]
MLKASELLKECGILLLIAAAVTALYGHALGFGFAYDDDPLIETNPYIKDPGYIGSFFLTDMWRLSRFPASANYYRPLDMLSFYLDHAAWGLNARMFHLTNILLFILTSLLVYTVIRAVSGSRLASILGTAIFIVHPVSGIAACWISGRNEPLFLIFTLASFLMFRQADNSKSSSGRVFLCAGSAMMFALGLLSKEAALFLLPLLAWHDYCFTCDFSVKRILKKLINYLPLFVVAVVYLWARYVALEGASGIYIRHPKEMPLATCLALTLKSIPYYIKSALFPFPLEFQALKIPVVPSPDLAGIAATICLICFLLHYGFRYGLSFKKEVFFLGWAAITSANVLFVAILMGPRFLLFPLIGIAGFSGIFAAGRKKLIIYGVTLALIISMAVSSYCNTLHWKDNSTLLELMVKKYPKDPIIIYQIGCAYSLRNDLPSAIAKYKEALDIQWDVKEARFNLAHAYFNLGRFDDAITEFEELAKHNGLMPQIHQALAVIYEKKDLYGKAIKEVQYELSLGTPEYAKMLLFLYQLYEENGESPKALRIRKLLLNY